MRNRACQRVVEGTQSMTVYRPLCTADETAVEIATCWNGIDPATKFDVSTTNNGKSMFPPVADRFSYMYAATADRMQESSTTVGWLKRTSIKT
jgi:ABC-type xylose transport system substrate-binding protein